MAGSLIKRLLILKVLLLSLGCSTSSISEEWLSYEPTVVSLEGELISRTEYGPPNYGETPNLDKKSLIYLIKLKNAINVKGDPEDEVNRTDFKGLKELQIVDLDGNYNYQQFMHKTVVIKGTLSEAVTGHQYTNVIFIVDEIKQK
jgi:hypothetical protein